jgi:hypothetical protein
LECHKELFVIFLFLAIAAGIGFFIQAPHPDPLSYGFSAAFPSRLFGAILSVLYAILSWSTFHLLVPAPHFQHRKLLRLRIIVVPLVWMTLVIITSILLHQFSAREWQEFDRFFNTPIKALFPTADTMVLKGHLSGKIQPLICPKVR